MTTLFINLWIDISKHTSKTPVPLHTDIHWHKLPICKLHITPVKPRENHCTPKTKQNVQRGSLIQTNNYSVHPLVIKCLLQKTTPHIPLSPTYTTQLQRRRHHNTYQPHKKVDSINSRCSPDITLLITIYLSTAFDDMLSPLSN